MTTNKIEPKNHSLQKGIFFACITVLIALIIPVLTVQQSDLIKANPLYQHLFQSILNGLIAVTGIYLIRSKVDKGSPASIGLAKPSKAIFQLLFGFGLILIPLLLTILLSQIFGWAEITLNTNNGILTALIIGMISTFFTDAFTEELIFRGYIFSKLEVRFNVWISSLITLLLFVVLPIIIISFQELIGIQAVIPISVAYVVNLILFGAFVQYLRILTKSIWVGMGFHWFFVHMNELMGVTDDKIIQFSESSNHQALQITIVILLLMVFAGLLLYPILKREKQIKVMILS